MTLTDRAARLQHAMVVRCTVYQDGQRQSEIDLDAINGYLQDERNFVWLGLREPNADLLAQVQQAFNLHDLAIEDARSAHQHPKVEAYGETLFIVFHTACWNNNALQFGETHVFVGPRFFISIRHGTPIGFARVRERCESMPSFLAKGGGFILYALMDYIVDHYILVVDGLQEHLEVLEADIFQSDFNEHTLAELYKLKRELLLLRSAAAPMQDVCNELMHFHDGLVNKDVRFYYRDISDHVKRVNHAIDRMQEMLSNAMQIHLALVTVRQNDVVKRLAGWGAVLAIPTMVFSLYGMNFKFMPELDWPYAYPSVLGGVVLLCAVLYLRLKNSGWL